jgi:hypothetical protein
MIRAVLDVNVLISALISRSGAPARILEAWQAERFLVVTSEPILAEFQRVLAQPQLRNRYGLTPSRVQRLLRGLRQFALVTPGELELHGLAPDPDDDKLLACAVEGGADYLVSGDKDLLNLGEHEGVQLVAPAEFIRRLEER